MSMAKLSLILVLSSLFITALLPLAYSELKVTRFRFYLQDKYTGGGKTVYKVAECDITSNSPSYFGEVDVVNDPLTVEPDHNSKLIGYAQGIIASADLNEPAIHVSLTFVFTDGDYKGSTLVMVGRNDLVKEYRRIPIVGGTGAFELAHGIVTTRNYSADPTTARATFEFNVAVVQSQEIAMLV